MVRKEFDETKKIVEQSKVEDSNGNIISLEQKVTYIDPDGEEHIYNSVGEGDTIEVIMPDSQRIDVEYAKDSLEGVEFRRVIVGVNSDDGVLVIPEGVLPIIVDYGYCVSVTNKDMHVVLYEDVVAGLSAPEGEIVLSIEPADSTNMNRTQMRIVGDSYAVSIELKVNGSYVTQLKGDAEVSLVPGYLSISVNRVSEDGSLEPIEFEYDIDTGKLTFQVQHFSIYMVGMEGSETSEPPYMLIIVALIVAAVLVVAFLLSRRSRE